MRGQGESVRGRGGVKVGGCERQSIFSRDRGLVYRRSRIVYRGGSYIRIVYKDLERVFGDAAALISPVEEHVQRPPGDQGIGALHTSGQESYTGGNRI